MREAGRTYRGRVCEGVARELGRGAWGCAACDRAGRVRVRGMCGNYCCAPAAGGFPYLGGRITRVSSRAEKGMRCSLSSHDNRSLDMP